MSKRRRRPANPPEKRPLLKRQPAVWLATLSTVVGLATGMFTLRDQVFPREAGTAAAVSVPAYQQQIARICDEVNANDRQRARSDKTIKRRLRRAQTTISQRNALLDGVRLTAARSGHTLASFTALEPPPTLAATRQGTEAAWNRNLARLRDYSAMLDRVGRRKQLTAAIDHLSTLRPAIARDGDRLRSGLQRLGGANCDLAPPIITPTYTLPTLQANKHKIARTDTPADASTPSSGDPTTSGTPATNDPPTADSAGGAGTSGSTPPQSTSGANTPPSTGAAPATGGVNTPPPSGGVNTPHTGGGED